MGSNIDDREEHIAYAVQLVCSIALPMVLLNARKLKLLETIAEAGPDAQLSTHEIASRLSIKNQDAPEMLDRMLRLLASHSIVTCSKRDNESRPVRVYGLAPVAKFLIPNEDGSFGSILELHQDKVFVDSWYKLNESVLEGGIAFDKVYGKNAFEYLGLDPRFNDIFNKAMSDASTIVMKEIVKCYKGFNNLKCVVDVGGGLGATLHMIVSEHPTINGINFDLPHVIQHAPVLPRIEHVAGDMFCDVPQGDGIFLKWVLHNWGDEHCVKLLKKCYEALPHNGKVIVVDKILPFVPDTSSYAKATTSIDTIMMTEIPGGKERTEDEFLALAKAAGFGGMRKECFACNFWVMEFYK